MKTFKTWAGQGRCTPKTIARPSTTIEVQRVVREAQSAGRRVRVLGSGHSPSDIAMSDDVLVSLERMNSVVAIDPKARTATVQGGTTLAQLDDALRPTGWTIPNLGSISVQTIAGTVATGTHGTGLAFGSLGSFVEAATLVTGSGEIVRISRTENPGWLEAVRCHLGALGIITKLTFTICEAFDLCVEERPLNLAEALVRQSDGLKCDHYRFWYLPHADRAWEWRATRARPQPRASRSLLEQMLSFAHERLIGFHAFEAALFAATFTDSLVPPINRAYAKLMFSRARTARGPSRAMFNFDCLFKQHVDEWAIPIERTGEAMIRLRDLIATRGYRVHLPIEVRFVGREDTWLSPAYGRDTCYIGVISYMPYGRSAKYAEYFAEFERLMAEFGGRPHWAKRFGLTASELAPLYPRWKDFAELRARLDPQGVLANAYTERVLGPVV